MKALKVGDKVKYTRMDGRVCFEGIITVMGISDQCIVVITKSYHDMYPVNNVDFWETKTLTKLPSKHEVYAKFNSEDEEIDMLKEKRDEYKKENDALTINKNVISTVYNQMCDDSNELVYKINLLTDKIITLESKA